MRRAVKKTLSFFKIAIHRTPHRAEVWNNAPSDRLHQVIIPFATYSPWLTNREFVDAYSAITDHTLVDLFRCYELWSLAKQSCKIEGDILEVGVWRGGSGAILAEAVRLDTSKRVYLADTFQGVVKAGENDPKYIGGEHNDTSEGLVRQLLFSQSLSNCDLLVGTFPESTGHQVRGKLSLVHCDVDVYESARDVFNWCAPRLSVGGAFVFDDYGFSGCEGVAMLCEEIAEREDYLFMHNLNGHAVLVKIR